MLQYTVGLALLGGGWGSLRPRLVVVVVSAQDRGEEVSQSPWSSQVCGLRLKYCVHSTWHINTCRILEQQLWSVWIMAAEWDGGWTSVTGTGNITYLRVYVAGEVYKYALVKTELPQKSWWVLLSLESQLWAYVPAWHFWGLWCVAGWPYIWACRFDFKAVPHV